MVLSRKARRVTNVEEHLPHKAPYDRAEDQWVCKVADQVGIGGVADEDLMNAVTKHCDSNLNDGEQAI